MYNCVQPAFLKSLKAIIPGDFTPESEVDVAFDFDAGSGAADYVNAKSWAYDRFGRNVRWRLIEREARAVFSFARYPDALMFAMSIDGAVIRAPSAA